MKDNTAVAEFSTDCDIVAAESDRAVIDGSDDGAEICTCEVESEHKLSQQRKL